MKSASDSVVLTHLNSLSGKFLLQLLKNDSQSYLSWPLLCKPPTILFRVYLKLLLLFLTLLLFLSSSFPPFLSVFLSYSPISLFPQRCSFCVRYIHLFVKPRNTYRMFYQSPSLWSKVIINLKNSPFKVSCFSFLEWTEVGRMYISAAAFFLFMPHS